ncbi:MAG: AraC family transcriptional regulator [Cellvibrionaceae bacterium]|nr:AraC family transcriptional regulator [Cellvibrionaceae bacterium]
MSIYEYLPIASAKSLLQGLSAAGGDSSRVLDDIGLARNILESDDQFPVRKSGELVLAISRHLEDETLGFLERKSAPGSIQMCLYALISAPTLGQALTRLIHYWRLINPEINMSIRREGAQAYLSGGLFNQNKDVAFAYVSWSTLFLYRLLCWLVDKDLQLEAITFSFAEPEDGKGYGDMFNTQVRFSSSVTAMVFDPCYLDFPIVRENQDIDRFIAALPELMTLKAIDVSVIAKISRYIKFSANPNAVSFDEVSKSLNLSPDILRRRLAKEGVKFQDIKDNIRREMAIYELQKPYSNVSEIAYSLGFSEPSAFNRAFKQWTGMSPGRYKSFGKQGTKE